MKNITLILVLTTATIISAFGQSELKYFKTHTFHLEGVNPSSGFGILDSIPITIGANRTLKIESVICGENDNTGLSSISSYRRGVYLDNSYIGPILQSPPFPIWLESGNYTLKLTGTSGGNVTSIECKVSALEFSIAP